MYCPSVHVTGMGHLPGSAGSSRIAVRWKMTPWSADLPNGCWTSRYWPAVTGRNGPGITPPGGWAFEFHNDHYPDIDDTSEVIMAIASVTLQADEEVRRRDAIDRGVVWLSALQCKNGGWAAFDKDNNAKYLTKLPFSDFGETLDPRLAPM